MKILQTPARFYPAVGGVEKYTLELSRALTKQGHEVTVVCANEPAHKRNNRVHKINVKRLRYGFKVANTNITFKLLHTLLREDFDIIHTHIPTPWSADISALASLIKRKPLVVTYHNDLTRQNGVEGLILKIYNATFLKLVLWRASKIIITQPRYIEFSKYLQNYKDKIETVPLGVVPPRYVEKLRRKPNQLFFLSVLDRHHEYKGLDVLLNALVKVKKNNPEVKLIVGGKGDLISYYKNLAKKLGLDEQVSFLGYVPNKDLAKLYASSGVFVLPSINNQEGFGMVALEALSYGTPVITTSLAGSSEFIKEKKAGLIVPPRDVSSLAKSITILLDKPQMTLSMGKSGAIAVSKQYNWDTIAEHIIDIYKDKITTRPKIIQVTAYYPPHLGGQENAVQDLATQLALLGEKVEVVSSNIDAKAGVSVESGVNVTRLKSIEKAHTPLIWNLLPWLLRHAKSNSVVHLHVGQVYTPEIVWLASKIKRFKYIVQMHTELVESSSTGKFLPLYKALFLKRSIRGASLVIVLNNENKNIIENEYSFKGPVLVMNNGINEEYFQVNRPKRTNKKKVLKLLFVGRLSPGKNLQGLLEAIADMQQQVNLDIVGDGEEREKVKQIIKEKKIRNVKTYGKLSRSEVIKHYTKTDALIMPSFYEAQPLVLLEAMAAGVPVIGSEVRGIKEHVNGLGILVKTTPEGIKKGIIDFSGLSLHKVSEITDKAKTKMVSLSSSKIVSQHIRNYQLISQSQDIPKDT